MVRSGGKAGVNISSLEEVDLPVYKGSIQGLNTADLDCLVIASDLKGRIDNGKGYNSLGSILPDRLMKLFHFLYPEVDHQRIGVFLCGNMYAQFDKRDGFENVKRVWRVFNQHSGFVAGVAGDHDDFGDAAAFEEFKKEDGIYYLDGEMKKVAGLKIGDLSRIIG